jgi:hypothetical protein
VAEVPSRRAPPGATLGATRMNDLPVLRTDMNSEAGMRPRSQTVLNGSGRPYRYLRIRCSALVVYPNRRSLADSP